MARIRGGPAVRTIERARQDPASAPGRHSEASRKSESHRSTRNRLPPARGCPISPRYAGARSGTGCRPRGIDRGHPGQAALCAAAPLYTGPPPPATPTGRWATPTPAYPRLESSSTPRRRWVRPIALPASGHRSGPGSGALASRGTQRRRRRRIRTHRRHKG